MMLVPVVLFLLFAHFQHSPEPGDTPSWLLRYDVASRTPAQVKLPKRLSEASGLTVSEEGKLFTHDDEQGVIYQVDYTTGKIAKQFSIGSIFMKEDFEGIAMKKDTIFLVTSDGKILQFREGEDKANMKFTLHRTPLSRRNDVEGLEYDPETDCLLLALKGDPRIKGRTESKDLSPYKAVYAYSLKEQKLLDEPRFLIPHARIHVARRGQFHPSGIARHPVSGSFFIISATGACIIELSRDGEILAQAELPRKVNSQPEGIAFAPDLSMLICNDGQGGTGTLTVYPVME